MVRVLYTELVASLLGGLLAQAKMRRMCFGIARPGSRLERDGVRGSCKTARGGATAWPPNALASLLAARGHAALGTITGGEPVVGALVM